MASTDESDVDIDLSPDGGAVSDADLGDLRVNFSDEEAGSKALDFSPAPTGKYKVAITDVSIRRSTSEKNPGKPYYNVEMTVQEGPYENRKFWGNVMLFEGALYSLAQLEKAVGWSEEKVKSGQVVTTDELLGEQIIISVVKMRDSYREKEAGDGEKLFKNEVKGYMPLTDAKLSGASSSGGSLMP